MTRGRGIVRYLAWWAVLTGVLVGLWRLPVPTVVPLAQGTPDDLLPLLSVGLRWFALAAVLYLMATTVLATVAEVVRSASLSRLSDRVALPVVRRVVRAGVGASLVVGLGIGPSAAAAAPGPPGATGTRDVGSAATAVGTEDAEHGETRAVDDLRRSSPPGADDAAGHVPDEVTTDEAPADDGAEVHGEAEVEGAVEAEVRDGERDASVPVASGTTEQDEHVVVAGDSFWSVAVELRRGELGRDPTDTEVVALWERLIDANRDRLVVAGDPDLLVPGQRLRIDVTVERT